MSLTSPKLPKAAIGAPTSHVRFRVLGLLASLSMLTYVDRICIQRLQPAIQHDLHLSDSEFGFVFSAFLWGYALFEVPVGWLSDVWGARKVILRIVLWWSLFTALTGAVYEFWPDSPIALPFGWGTMSWALLSLILARFLFGCGEAGVYPTLANVVRVWYPLSERGFAQGIILMANRFGSAISPLVVGLLAAWFGWRGAFYTLGIVGVAWAVLFALVFRERPAEHPLVSSDELERIGTPPTARLHGGPKFPLRIALSRVSIWAMGALYMLSISFGWTFYVTWQPKYLEDVYKLSFDDSQWLVGLPYLCGAVGCLLGGRLSDFILRQTGSLRWSRSLVGIGGLSVAGVCFLTASVIHDQWQTVLLFSLAALASDMFLAPYWAAITDVGGRFTGTLGGAFNMFALLGGGVFASLIPWLRTQNVEWSHVLQVIGFAWLAAAAMWILVDASRPLLPSDEQEVPAAE